jgi:hypothetical protein
MTLRSQCEALVADDEPIVVTPEIRKQVEALVDTMLMDCIRQVLVKKLSMAVVYAARELNKESKP